MPRYEYLNEATGETKEVIQTMNEEHVYFENGVEWKRIFCVPNAVIDNSVDPNNINQFSEKIKNSKGTIGDIYDRSKELSEKRAAAHNGIDPLKQKYFEEYKSKHHGGLHPEQAKEKNNGTIEI